MWNSDYSETKMLNTLKEVIQQRLPEGWALSLIEEDRRLNRRTDATLEIKSPDGITATALVEVKQRPLEAREIISQFRWCRNSGLNQSKESISTENNCILVAPYLGRSARVELIQERISYVDMTGNIRLVLRQPAVFIEAQGATKNPFRENVPLKSLRGRSAGRVVRGILDYQPRLVPGNYPNSRKLQWLQYPAFLTCLIGRLSLIATYHVGVYSRLTGNSYYGDGPRIIVL
jgi:hypothetical protein